MDTTQDRGENLIYHRFRALGWKAESALRAARIRVEFDSIPGLEIRFENGGGSSCPCQEMFDEEMLPNKSEREREWLRNKFLETFEDIGARVWLDDLVIDSIWGFANESYFWESGYAEDLMSSGIQAYYARPFL